MNRSTIVAGALIASGALHSQISSAQALGQARLWDEPGPCDRDCLIAIADDYIAAVVAGNPNAVPLAEELKFTENTVLMEPGEGLWATATGSPGEFQLYVPDPVSRMVGYIGIMESSDEPIQLGLRLAINDDGEITEAEHMIVRNLSETSLANLRTPRPGLLKTATLPPNEQLPREIMLVIAQTYYDAIELNDGEATLFADQCMRQENGMITAAGDASPPRDSLRSCKSQLDSRSMSYVDSIDLRRVWIADEVTGLVFGVSQFRHSMADKTLDIYDDEGNLVELTVDYDPFDLPAMHVFKIRNGRLYDIEAMGFATEYMAPNGWSPHLR